MRRVQLSGAAVLVGVLVSFPALRDAFLDHTLDARTAIIRLVIAIGFAMVAIAVVQTVVDSYRSQNALRELRARDDHPRRRADDA